MSLTEHDAICTLTFFGDSMDARFPSPLLVCLEEKIRMPKPQSEASLDQDYGVTQCDCDCDC